MTDAIHPELHPDADQISAFVEHALPAHEQQQMLGHLAVCPQCRAIVALSLPPEPETPAPAKNWFGSTWLSGWWLAVPAGVAVAAVLAITIHLRNASQIQHGNDSSQQVAVSHPPTPPVSEDSLAETSKPSSVPQRRSSPPVASQKLPELKPLPPRMPVPSEARIQPPALADDKLQANSPSLSFNPLDQPKAKAAPSPGAQAGLAAGAPTNSSAPVAGATAGAAIAQKIGALQNTPIFAVSAGAAGGPAVKKDATPAQFILPSGLPVVSIATHVQQVLAIDANHAVFLSSDGGTSWQAVPVSWRGRAVRVDMVSHGLTRAFAPAHAAQQSAFATGTNPIPAPAPSAVPPAPPAQLTGAVTDATGAVIPGASISATSHDGQSATAITDRTGHYSFNALAPGIYDIRTQSPGFQQQLTQAVTVSSGQPAVANVTLSIGAATETVEVESADASIQTEVSERKSRDKKIAPVPSDIFEMITDSGERWTSPDGLVWQRK